jgi:hypothetical protein
MLSLKYYGIVHKADTEDYMQSLRVHDELDKNDFQQHMYAVRVKPTAEPSDLQEFHPSSAAISEFDDDEEIVPDRKRKQQCGRDEDTEMDEADPTAFTEELRTVDASSQLFLSTKRTRGEQLQITGGLYVGGGVFARPEQNSVRISDSETETDSQEGEQVSGYEDEDEHEDEQAIAAMAERRRKGKQAVAECPHPEANLAKSNVAKTPGAEAPTEGAPQQKETSVEEPFLLSDDDDPVPDLEHDNQLPREELLEALEEQDVTAGSLAQTQEEQDQNMVRMKFESYWEQKEEKRRKKAESEALHRQEMEVLKESVKRAEEVGQNVSRSITGLAQSVQDSIQENNWTMMQAIFQMLHGVGFAPALQSSYTQGEYPLVLGFKPPPDVSAKRLPASAIQFTPPTTIPGVPIPALGRTEENQSEERPGEAAINDRE